MPEPLDVLLLFALPASGKSEVRRYLASQPPERRAAEFHLGPLVQLDDFPYVHALRTIDAALTELGAAPVFFHAPDRSFIDPWDWGTLTRLVDDDWRAVVTRRTVEESAPARWLFDRIDEAALRAGARIKLAVLPDALRESLSLRLELLAADLLREQREGVAAAPAGRTFVIEFARGGPTGAASPLPPPVGYAHALAQLSPELLERAAILYVWVTPEESRRKNEERADPDDPGSILHHGVPLEVMLGDYGCDDVEWLLETSDRTDTVRVEAHGRTFYLPAARFDNRVDRTSFVRRPQEEWPDAEVAALHEGLREALERLAAARR
jgi:hypothetical protein